MIFSVGDIKGMIFLCSVFCCCVVGKAAPGASIKVVQVIQNIEHAEGEIFAVMTLLEFRYLVMMTMCILRSLCALSSFHLCHITAIIDIIFTGTFFGVECFSS